MTFGLVNFQDMALPHIIFKRSFSTSLSKFCIKHVSIIGGGIMGSGIAQVIAQNGIEVSLVEQNSKLVKKSEERIIQNLRRATQNLRNPQDQDDFIVKTLSKISGYPSILLGIRDSCLIIEALPEDFDAKKKILAEIDQKAPDSSIIVSNTSSFSIQELSESVSRKDKFAGLHYFNPAWDMKLIELIRSHETSDETFEKLKNFAESIGKTCISCKDTPGFIVNRLLVAYFSEALRMLERGDADVTTTDLAMKLGLKMPMGPFQLMDFVGLDTLQSSMEEWYKKYPENPIFKNSDIVKKMVMEGKLGQKSGHGFYQYKK